MIAAYYLVIVFIGGGPGPSSMTMVPMESLQVCEAAAVKAVSLEGMLSKVRTTCLEAHE